MNQIDNGSAGVPIRKEIVALHERLAEHRTMPGTWWTGFERRAIAEAARAADIHFQPTLHLSPTPHL